MDGETPELRVYVSAARERCRTFELDCHGGFNIYSGRHGEKLCGVNTCFDHTALGWDRTSMKQVINKSRT